MTISKNCAICGNQFQARRSDVATCGKDCRDEKHRRSIKARYQDPVFREKQKIATAKAQIEWHADPKNAEAFALRSSERMKRRHADPEWQKIRNERSSRVMHGVWQKHRDKLIALSSERYQAGIGINSEESKARKNKAAKWIMQKARDALITETDYSDVFKDVQERLRREYPYDGPLDNSDYYDYSRRLGKLVVNSPECRAPADSFMSEAIPRFADKWQKMKDMEIEP